MKTATFLAFFLVASVTHAFAVGKQLTGQHAPANSPAMTPAESQKAFTVPPGFEVRLFAAEPDVINPVAMTWDERGRLWVVELYEYPLGAPAGTKGRDRIKILEDTDGDGVADKVTIFADGLNLATGIALGNGGVYVGQAPDLLFLKDTNNDDHADTREVLLTGFGLNDRHELLNGFTWGPDGWLYMTHGVFNHSQVKIPEASTPGVEVSAALARFDPRTKKFEVFADGTSNPWGVDFDRYGNAFVSACVIDHMFHLAPGGIYARQGGTPANPYAYELLPSIVDHKHYMAAYSGICIYQGDNFPEEYRGHVFFGNIHQSAINHDRLVPNGSSWKSIEDKDFLTTTDGWFRPVSEQVGPDGAMWIADWYDKYPCYQNAQADPEGVDRKLGRIWRVIYTGKEPGKKLHTRPDPKMDFSKMSSGELVKQLENPNVWQRRMAQRLFTEKYFSWMENTNRNLSEVQTDRLIDLVEGGKTLETRLAAYWTIRNCGMTYDVIADPDRSNPAKFGRRTRSADDAALLAWKARMSVTQQKDANNNLYPSCDGFLLEKLASDPDPTVRLAVATAVRQIVSSSLTVDVDFTADIHTTGMRHESPVGKILATLIKSSADAKDPLLPFMIWLAGEPGLAAHPEGGLKWLADNGADTMPLSGILAAKAMRRICDMNDRKKLDLAVDFIGQIAKTPDFAIAALDGLIEAQKGKALLPSTNTTAFFIKLRFISGTREGAISKNLTNSSSNPWQILDDLKARTLQLGTLWGDAGCIAATLEMINDPKAAADDRIKGIRAAAQLHNDAGRTAVEKVLAQETSEPILIEALRALGTLGGDNVPPLIVKRWKDLTLAARQSAADVLVSRHPWTEQFLNAVQDKIISSTEISASVFRAISKYKDKSLDERSEKLLGRFRESDADKLKIIREKRKIVLAGDPDIKKGHDIAKRTCFVCHMLYGEGANVGPDLTGVGRSSLDALLANVIDPNQVVGKGYENVEVETKDGRSVSGRLVEDTATHIKLISAGPKEDVVAKSDIESQRTSKLSVMPEGLEQMPDEDFRNLVWFILNPPQDNRPMTMELRHQLIGK